MKRVEFILAAVLAAPAVAMAQSDMKGMDTKGMDHQSMKAEKRQTTHKTIGVVKKVDPKTGSVTLAHEPVKSMNWPAMTMAFQVKDKAMLDKSQPPPHVSPIGLEVRTENSVEHFLFRNDLEASDIVNKAGESEQRDRI